MRQFKESKNELKELPQAHMTCCRVPLWRAFRPCLKEATSIVVNVEGISFCHRAGFLVKILAFIYFISKFLGQSFNDAKIIVNVKRRDWEVIESWKRSGR